MAEPSREAERDGKALRPLRIAAHLSSRNARPRARARISVPVVSPQETVSDTYRSLAPPAGRVADERSPCSSPKRSRKSGLLPVRLAPER